MSRRYLVRICRPRFEVAIVSINAEERSQAETAALEVAKLLSDDEWQLEPFDHQRYCPHVQIAACEADVAQHDPTAGQMASKAVRYLLLLIDDSKERWRIIFEPWFDSLAPGELLEHDAVADWALGLFDESHFATIGSEQSTTIDIEKGADLWGDEAACPAAKKGRPN
jgi:hypothetical protein